MVEGMQQSSDEFYREVERLIGFHQLQDAKVERISVSEGGLLSAKREYLQVRRKEHVFHICAAPFGNGFFVSWWLGEIQSGLFAILCEIPYLGKLVSFFGDFLKPTTYYRVDTALMFQSVTHGAVTGVLDGIIHARGLRELSDSDRKPIMKDFFERLG